MTDANTSQQGGSVLRGLRRKAKTFWIRRRRGAALKRKAGGRRTTSLLVAVLVLLLGSFAWAQSYLVPQPSGREISLDEVRSLAILHRIESATFEDEDNRLVGSYVNKPIDAADEERRRDSDGKRKKKVSDADSAASGAKTGDPMTEEKNKERATRTRNEKAVAANAPAGSGRFWASYPESDAAFAPLFDMLTKGGSTVTVDRQTPKIVVRVVSTYLIPLMILASFFGLLFSGRGGSSGIGQVMTFGTIGAKRRNRKTTASVSFEDVGGAGEAVAELKEVVDYLANPDRYEQINAIPPKGVLLFGPPGCGKTLLAKAVAGEAGVPFFSVAGAEFVEALVGVGAARVRDLFQRVRAVAPAIVFIDEIDAAGRKRGAASSGGGSDEREQTLNQLLVEMDGFEVGAGIVVMGATNRPDILDPALLRPGRFDRHITVDQPDAEGRCTILKLHARGKPIDPSVDFDYLARRTPGFSGADLANVINEAALLSLREKKSMIEVEELQEAIQRVLHGPKRRGRVLSEEERRRVAYHESGHAVIAAALGEGKHVHRVTILLRSRGLGSTSVQRDDEALVVTRTQLYSSLVKAMGGMAAEELVLGEPSTGAEQDVEQATAIARDIVGRYGMSPVIGRTRLLASDVDVFLGTDSGVSNVSSSTHEEFDRQVKMLIDQAEAHALELLTSRRWKLDEVALRLMEDETLEGKLLEEILESVASDPIEDPFKNLIGARSAAAASDGELAST